MCWVYQLRMNYIDCAVCAVLQGLAEVAEQRDVLLAGAAVEVVPSEEEQSGSPIRQPKRWDLNLQRPDLDYSEIFAEDVGTLPGLTVWQIENFAPVEVEEGKFTNPLLYIAHSVPSLGLHV